MNRVRFEGFSPGLFRFLSGLAENNNKPWFDEHRREYEAEVLEPVKAFVAELGPIIHMLNEEIEIEPRVGRTISRISNDMRFHKNRPPYRPVIYVGFSQRGQKWWNSALLYAGIYPNGVSVGFYPGGNGALRTRPIYETIKKNSRPFQRYLDERAIAESYWELAGAEDGRVTKWPLPKTARRWLKLDGFTVGEHFRPTFLLQYLLSKLVADQLGSIKLSAETLFDVLQLGDVQQVLRPAGLLFHGDEVINGGNKKTRIRR